MELECLQQSLPELDRSHVLPRLIRQASHVDTVANTAKCLRHAQTRSFLTSSTARVFLGGEGINTSSLTQQLFLPVSSVAVLCTHQQNYWKCHQLAQPELTHPRALTQPGRVSRSTRLQDSTSTRWVYSSSLMFNLQWPDVSQSLCQHFLTWLYTTPSVTPLRPGSRHSK
ncbi:hypothetical protein ElyMa_005397500 [Elysia marginata]|uniref:Uncharacterized protein n=1 Tax=Elysia marginata TaxID=1093978 RepID=A0AAV4EG33_9GAST|nr:hypothetical protein ElyMa_005397500 [Elysia marginata]